MGILDCSKCCHGNNNHVRTTLEDPSKYIDFELVPNDQYICPYPTCQNVPEIKNVYSEYGFIELECQLHGPIKLPVGDFFEITEKSKSYFRVVCANCNNQQKEQNNMYKYCTKCDKDFCEKCSEDYQTNSIREHKINHKQYCIPVNEKPHKCLYHPDSEINSFCETCHKNVCDKESSQEHKKHKIKKFNLLTSHIQDYIKKIKEKTEILGDIFIFNKTIIKNYENHPNNYLHIKSILNLGNSINDNTEKGKLINEDKEKIEFIDNMLNEFEKKFKMHQEAIKKLEKQFKIKLNGNEEILDLKDKNLGDEGFDLISKILFTRLKEINLSGNGIIDISPFKNMNLSLLKNIDLSFNNIENVNVLTDLKSPKLEEICLQNNKIKDLESLINNVIYHHLKRLRLENNNFEMDFKDLKNKLKAKYENLQIYCKVLTRKDFEDKYGIKFDNELDLSNKKGENQIIEDLYKVIGNDKNIKIKKLILKNNNITDCSLLSRIPLFSLEELDLSNNQIINLEFLSNMKVPNLKSINLDNNSINNIYPLNKNLNLRKELKKISLKKNKFFESDESFEPNENNLSIINILKDQDIKIELK